MENDDNLSFYLYVFECRYLDQYLMKYIQTFCGYNKHYYGENNVSDFFSRP